jgi:hypothetical protein
MRSRSSDLARKKRERTVASGRLERRGDLVDRHFLDRAHQEHRAERVGQGVDLPLEHRARLGAHRRALGRLGGARVVVVRRLVEVGAAIHPDHLRGPLALAPARDRLVDDDARQPGRELRVAAKAADRAVREQVSFLDCILGLGVVAENRARRAVEPLVVPPHHQLQRIAVAARDASGELEIV